MLYIWHPGHPIPNLRNSSPHPTFLMEDHLPMKLNWQAALGMHKSAHCSCTPCTALCQGHDNEWGWGECREVTPQQIQRQREPQCSLPGLHARKHEYEESKFLRSRDPCQRMGPQTQYFGLNKISTARTFSTSSQYWMLKASLCSKLPMCYQVLGKFNNSIFHES